MQELRPRSGDEMTLSQESETNDKQPATEAGLLAGHGAFGQRCRWFIPSRADVDLPGRRSRSCRFEPMLAQPHVQLRARNAKLT